MGHSDVRTGDSETAAGTPSVLRWEGGSNPYQTETEEYAARGERLLAAAVVPPKMKRSCGEYLDVGQYTFCAAAMPREHPCAAKATKKNSLPPTCGPPLKNGNWFREDLDHGHLVAISYGIRDRDPWSELLTNRWGVPARLYDCYWHSDVGPLTGDGHSHTNLSSDRPCQDADTYCYAMPYEAFDVCVDGTAGRAKGGDGRNRTYEQLSKALEGLPPLSVFLKMDVEGTEWDVIPQLLKSEEDLAKIRTLHIELHLAQTIHPVSKLIQFHDRRPSVQSSETIDGQVAIVEELARRMQVVGSAIGWRSEVGQRRHRQRLGSDQGPEVEPPVHPRKGYKMLQFDMSFVNRALF